jgi:carbamoyltransferase
MLNVIVPWLEKTKTRRLCCAGGCFLNVKFNQVLWYRKILVTQWIYPNPGDAGLAAGAALQAYFSSYPSTPQRRLNDVYLGPAFNDSQIEQLLNQRGLRFRRVENIAHETAKYLEKNLVVGWFQGRMESGPRALGNRSILMSPLKAENKDIINSKVKFREQFRPFCPSMLYEKADDYLIDAREECFMVTSFDVRPEKKEKIPAVVHVDGTARPQMVKKDVNPLYYELITEFGKLTGEYVILNTSFNVKGEPIVCTPIEAIRCFYSTGLDVLVFNNYIVKKPCIE